MYNILTNNNHNNFNINNKYKLNNIHYLCTDGHHVYNEIMNHFIYKNNIKEHIISKKETCLVESYNSSIRDTLNRLKRKSKGYSKSQYMLEISLDLWMYKKDIFNNIKKYSRYNLYEK